MKLLRKSLLLMVVLGGYLFLSLPATTHGFGTWDNTSLNILIRKVHEPQWKIGYNFILGCAGTFEPQEEELKAAMTKALRAWLQPLRERYPNKVFTDDFIFVQMPDIEKCHKDDGWERGGGREQVDVYITFSCGPVKTSFINWSFVGASSVCMRNAPIINKSFIGTLVHELGHAVGMLDTYATPVQTSTGGLAGTAGKQPTSVMAGISVLERPDHIAEDDKNGVIWLYKHYYEDHSAKDCFFPDYVHIGRGFCEPKYPLIFEAKHGNFVSVEMILKDDPTLELNAHDASGMTALHYAVQRLDRKMVEALLAKQGIKVNILGKGNHTPAQLARIFHQKDLAKMIEAHPSSKWPPIAWDVAPKGKLTTTWGHLKKRY